MIKLTIDIHAMTFTHPEPRQIVPPGVKKPNRELQRDVNKPAAGASSTMPESGVNKLRRLSGRF